MPKNIDSARIALNKMLTKYQEDKKKSGWFFNKGENSAGYKLAQHFIDKINNSQATETEELLALIYFDSKYTEISELQKKFTEEMVNILGFQRLDICKHAITISRQYNSNKPSSDFEDEAKEELIAEKLARLEPFKENSKYEVELQELNSKPPEMR
ncbi:hypothetical protein ACNVED_09890 [Legionella sp. D16C41]|uniref:hypothetical protein n=1 Tax=Legionella sp. D16C41 TaxID=3402688 RepID=UPI003AF7DAD1